MHAIHPAFGVKTPPRHSHTVPTCALRVAACVLRAALHLCPQATAAAAARARASTTTSTTTARTRSARRPAPLAPRALRETRDPAAPRESVVPPDLLAPG